MMAQRNSFINGIGLTEANSLIHLLNNDDTDDDNELNLVKHSAYYGEKEFSKMLSNKAGMSILSGNIQSINAKFDEFSSFVDRVNTHNPISAILLQECWIDDNAIDSLALFNLKEYNMVYQSSRCCRHGGLLIYIHKQFKYTLIDTINQDATGWEYLCIEMSHRTPHSQKYLLCNVYRKPGEIVDEMNAFLVDFSTFLQRVKNLNKLSYICGDYNIDLLKVKINPRFGEFFDHIISSGFFPKITLPTRFTDQSSTLIDNVFSTNIEEKEVSGILLNHISHKLVKSAKDVLIKPLTLLMNQIIHTGEFPKQLKIAKVKPLFKKGIQSSFTNYRPISLMPSISKIFEHVMTSQLMEYFTSKNLFCLQQFGFRPGHSTELAALKLVNHVITEMDNFNIPTNIYIDLSKAFDTLNFDILLNKLDYYGVQGCANRLIYSYLSDRWQFVEFNGHKSSYLPIKTGVPQGSVLGPLLFLIYINDLPLVSNVFDMLMYADDTTLYCNIKQDIGEEVINAELLKLWEWLSANKLSLNIAKTKYMVFHTSKRNVIYPNLKVNNNNIERVTQFNFLGVILHSHMTWNKHINHISMKIARSIGILYRLRNVYPESVLITIYNTLILPHFHYCLLLWGSVVKENHSLHLLQKKALRIITNSDYLAHTEPLCKKLRILKISDMFSVALWKFYYKLMNNKLPEHFSFMKPVLPVVTERYEIRNPSFHAPAIKHKFAECSLQNCLINQLNSENCFALLTDKVSTNSFYSFKVFIKNRILNSYQNQ